jgi:hypothetical protein
VISIVSPSWYRVGLFGWVILAIPGLWTKQFEMSNSYLLPRLQAAPNQAGALSCLGFFNRILKGDGRNDDPGG